MKKGDNPKNTLEDRMKSGLDTSKPPKLKEVKGK